jgi:hypothetical protein
MVLLIFLLSSLLACALLFVALSFRYGLTAQALLYKVLCRAGMTFERLRPAEVASLYARRKQTTGQLHRPLLLNLETSDGSGQVTHPDVVYIPEGFGAENWTYWMACTPYPDRNAHFENPELFVSYDGIRWVVPPGLTNPLVPSPKTAGDHHSDPDLLFHSGQLWLFYRQTLRSKSPTENRIFLTKSRDGLHWSVPVTVLSDNTGRELLSPAVIDSNGFFLMWTVEICGHEFVIIRRRSRDGVAWSAPEPCKLSGVSAPRRPWHIDVLQDGERLSATLVTCTGRGGTDARLHYAFSDDGGLTWSTEGFLFEKVYEFEAGMQYRASLLPIEGREGEYDLWYSVGCSRLLCSIAYVRLVRQGNRLVPSQLNARPTKESLV